VQGSGEPVIAAHDVLNEISDRPVITGRRQAPLVVADGIDHLPGDLSGRSELLRISVHGGQGEVKVAEAAR
jgi:hypothetical protein